MLRPGRYRTSLFEPRATFEIGRGWTLSEEASDRMLLLRRPEPRDEAVYLDSSQRELDVDQALRFVREAFVGTTGSPRDFHFSRVTTEDIGDRRGRGMTMSLRADQLVVSLAFATEAYEVRPGDVLRLSAIDVNGRTVLVFVEAPGSRFPGFSKQAKVVLSPLDFG